MFETANDKNSHYNNNKHGGRRGSIKDEQDDRYALSRISSGFSEREVLNYLVNKHKQTQVVR